MEHIKKVLLCEGVIKVASEMSSLNGGIDDSEAFNDKYARTLVETNSCMVPLLQLVAQSPDFGMNILRSTDLQLDLSSLEHVSPKAFIRSCVFFHSF